MELTIRCLGALQILLSWLTAPIYFLLTLRKSKPLPPIKQEIVLQSATELARKIRNQEYTSEQVVRAFVIRCNEVNPLLNAIVENCFADALNEAHTIDEMIFKGEKTVEELERETPFLGVPVTVKESVAVKGKSHSVGSLPRKDVKASCDAVAVANLRKAGAIPILVSNTPELCLCWESDNLVTGCTKNPYDAHRTPGGSSGGEAALLSAGASVIGIGSDIAGSIRIPASNTGIFGHKPSPGYVSLDGHYPNSKDEQFEQFLTIGPMTRYVEDLKPMFKILAGDKACLLNLDEEINLKKLRIMYNSQIAESLVMIPTDEEIKLAVEKAANHFNKNYGCPIKKYQMKELNDALEISISVFCEMEDIPNLMNVYTSDDPKAEKNLFMEFIKCIFGMSEFSLRGLIFTTIIRCNGFMPSEKRKEYAKTLKIIKEKLIDLLGDDGVFIIPTHPIPAYYHWQFIMKTAGIINTMIFNVLGMPATHVPMGLNKEGLPIGVQVVAAPNQDRLCLAVAEELGKAFGGWIPPS